MIEHPILARGAVPTPRRGARSTLLGNDAPRAQDMKRLKKTCVGSEGQHSPCQETGYDMIPRRPLLLMPVALSACATPLPPIDGEKTNPEAEALLEISARLHGLPALTTLDEINVNYEGEWRPIVARLQPALIEDGFRGRSEEHLRLSKGVVDQLHTGPLGQKQVERRWSPTTPGTIRVWYNGKETSDLEKRAAAALVADGYALFLLGPMLIAGAWSSRLAAMAVGAPERITVDGQVHYCDVLRVTLAPGLGLSDTDQLGLYIDRAERLMRRVRFSLDGIAGTRNAVAEVDTFSHIVRDGVRWPLGFYERLLRPVPLPVHDWRLTGVSASRA